MSESPSSRRASPARKSTSRKPASTKAPGTNAANGKKVSYGPDRAAALHRETREELARADAKSTTLLGVVGLILGAFLAGALAGNWSPERLGNDIEWLFWLGAAAALVSEGLLCAAVIPRLKHDKHPEHLSYFRHVVEYDSEEEFLAALEQVGPEETRIEDQVWRLSKTVQRKYRLIQVGLAFLASGVVLITAAFLIEHF